jgi:arylsulfatase A-like enzyme
MKSIRMAVIAVVLVAAGAWLGQVVWPRSTLPESSAAARRVPLMPASAQAQLDLAPLRAKRSAGAIDVVLVVSDTTRADDLQPYGSKLPTSPFLAAMARQGVTFKNAYSTSCWTVPAMYSMMTGLYPSEHGIVESTIAESSASGAAQRTQRVLPEQAVTLAERLKAEGYATFGVSTNLHLSARFGFGQGFDKFVDGGFQFKPFPRVAVESLRQAIHDSDKYFLWVHYFDAHFPYLERAPWFQQWNDSPFASFDDVSVSAALSDYWKDKRQPWRAFFPPEDVNLVSAYQLGYLLEPIRLFDTLSRVTAGPDNVRARDDYGRYLRAAYRSEVRSIDADMEFILRRLGVDDQTLIIFVADHGEEFFDHGRFGHRLDSLYQELISIPLVIRFPGGAHKGLVIEQPVSLVDLVPSIMELVHGKAPEGLLGHSFVPQLSDGAKPSDRELVAELTHTDGSEHRALVRYPWKYIHHYRDGSGELYDLTADPHEHTDLASRDAERTADMQHRLEAWKAGVSPRWPAAKNVSAQGDDLQKLRALGYTASP